MDITLIVAALVTGAVNRLETHLRAHVVAHMLLLEMPDPFFTHIANSATVTP